MRPNGSDLLKADRLKDAMGNSVEATTGLGRGLPSPHPLVVRQATKEERDETAETRQLESTAAVGTLFMALELGSTTWKVAFATTRQMRPRLRTVPAGALGQVRDEIALAKQRLGLIADAPVRSCYEAGRDGFWVHRALVAAGVENVVIDPASIMVDRRARRAKTDRLDATALVIQLMNAAAGDRRGWREVHVPPIQAEADRQLQREWEVVRDDRTRLCNRVHGLLATQGVRLALNGGLSRSAPHRAAVGWDPAARGTGGPARTRLDAAAASRGTADGAQAAPSSPRRAGPN